MSQSYGNNRPASSRPPQGRGVRHTPDPVEDQDRGTDPGTNQRPRFQMPPDDPAGRKFAGCAGIAFIIALFVAGWSIGGWMMLVAVFGVLFVLALIAGGVAFAFMGGSHGAHGEGAHGHAALPEWVNDNNIGTLIPGGTGIVSIGNPASMVPVFQYAMFGDPQAIVLGNPRNFKQPGVPVVRLGRHLLIPPWITCFFIDTSEKNLANKQVEVVPVGSDIPVKVPVTVTLEVARDENSGMVTTEIVRHHIGAHDGSVDHKHGQPVDLQMVVMNLVTAAVNGVEDEVKLHGVNRYFNSAAGQQRIVGALNHSLHHVGVAVTRVVFDAPIDPIAREVETIDRKRRVGVNANVAASSGSGGGVGTGVGGGGPVDMNAMLAVAMMSMLERMGAAPQQRRPRPQGGGRGNNTP